MATPKSTSALRQKLARIATATACDILRKHQPHQFVVRGSRPMVPITGSIAGPVRTLRFLPPRSDVKGPHGGNVRMTLIDAVREGEVLVFDTHGGPGQAGAPAMDRVRRLADDMGKSGHALPLASVKLLSPVPVPAQIRDFSTFEIHLKGAPAGMQVLKARLAGQPLPDLATLKSQIKPPPVYYEQPVYYISNRFSVVGTDTDVAWPTYSQYLDFELEIGIFIGKHGKDVPLSKAREHIFGYAIFNDFSARDRQAKEMDGFMGPTKGKSFDTGNAIGPWIVTPDEIPDAGALNVVARVNGEVWAQNTTANMLQSFEQMIAYVSVSETLHPGEFFASGTVGGCTGLEHDRWLKPGDVVELNVERLGILRNRVVRS